MKSIHARKPAHRLFALANATLLAVSLITMVVPASVAQAATSISPVSPVVSSGPTDGSGPTTDTGITCTLVADPATIVSGNGSALTLTSSAGAVSATIDNVNGDVSDIEDANGSVSVTPSVTTTYTAHVTGDSASQTTTCSATVTVTDGPTVSPAGPGPGPSTPSCSLMSDTNTMASDPNDTTVTHKAVLVSHPHSAWTHLLDAVGAKWIWGEDPVADTTVDETEVFTKTFNLLQDPTTGTLDIAADNGYDISVNGTEVPGANQLAVEDNFSATTTYNILPFLNQGTNTVTFTVKNLGVPGSDESSNPAGLDYALHVDGSACGPTVSNIPTPTTSVTVCKEDENGNKLAGWQLTLRKADKIGGVEVSSTDGTAAEQTIPGVGVGHYVARATGEYVYRPGDPIASTSDAAYSLRDPQDPVYGGPYAPWVRENDFPAPNQGWLGVMINDNYTDWGSIFNPNPNHKYWTNIDATTTQNLNFNILDDQYGDNSGTIRVDVFKGFTGVTGENGCTTFQNVPYGNYELHEIHKQGWTRIDNNHHVTVNADSNHFTVVNDDGKGPKVNVVATKVICDNESDLPNWGGSSHTTDANTAQAWVDQSDGKCHLAPDWHFEWANQDGANSGGSFVGDYGNGYTDFGPTDANGVASTSISLADVSEVHMREVLQNGYVPFSDNAGDNPDVSAEFYCSDDGLNYDNWDFIRNPQDKSTYYCVAFNAPDTSKTLKVHIYKYMDDDGDIAQVPNDSLDPNFPMVATWNAANIGSGTGDYILGNNWGGASFRYAADTSPMSVPADYTTNEVTATGVDAVVVPNQDACVSDSQFYLEGYKTGDTLEQAEAAEPTSDIPNFTGLTADKYVIVQNAPCSTGGGGGDNPTLTIVKNATGGDGEFTFDLAHDDGSQQYQVQTTEGTGESDQIALVSGHTYNLSEEVPEGWDLNSASCSNGNEAHVGQQLSENDPLEFTPTGDENITCTFHNTNTSDEVDHMIVVHNEDLASDASDVSSNPTKWFFFDDTSNQIVQNLGTFVTGPSTPPLGTGSVEFNLDSATSRDNIATAQYGGTMLADITALKFSAYSHSGVAGANESPYVTFNVDFTGSNTYQNRLVYVPANNAVSVPQDTWNSYDMVNGGTANWVYSGATWPVGVGEPGTTPGTTAKTWSQILTTYPNIKMLSLYPFLGVRVGEPGPTGYAGDTDKVVVGTTDGTTNTVNTYDFEPTTQTGTGGGSTGGGGGHSANKGTVLGASTTTEPQGQVLGASCGLLLTTFMHMGWASNVVDEVSKLQNFLDQTMNAGIPVTGFFGPITEKGVRDFQLANATDVLKPWVGVPESGIASQNDATGYVYKTTQWKINMLNCPDLDLPFPSLP